MEVNPERSHLEHPAVVKGELGDPLAVGVRAVAAAKVRKEILPAHAEDLRVETRHGRVRQLEVGVVPPADLDLFLSKTHLDRHPVRNGYGKPPPRIALNHRPLRLVSPSISKWGAGSNRCAPAVGKIAGS